MLTDLKIFYISFADELIDPENNLSVDDYLTIDFSKQESIDHICLNIDKFGSSILGKYHNYISHFIDTMDEDDIREIIEFIYKMYI